MVSDDIGNIAPLESVMAQAAAAAAAAQLSRWWSQVAPASSSFNGGMVGAASSCFNWCWSRCDLLLLLPTRCRLISRFDLDILCSRKRRICARMEREFWVSWSSLAILSSTCWLDTNELSWSRNAFCSVSMLRILASSCDRSSMNGSAMVGWVLRDRRQGG